MDSFVEILKLASVGLIAGLFTSFVANRNHRYNKQWELRVTAYQDVIEALSDLVHYYDKHYTAEINRKDLNENVQDKLSRHWDVAFPKVRKAADSGAFLLSDDVNNSLEKFVKCNSSHYDSYFEYLDTNLSEASRCLSSVVIASKKDLKIRGQWL